MRGESIVGNQSSTSQLDCFEDTQQNRQLDCFFFITFFLMQMKRFHCSSS